MKIALKKYYFENTYDLVHSSPFSSLSKCLGKHSFQNAPEGQLLFSSLLQQYNINATHRDCKKNRLTFTAIFT